MADSEAGGGGGSRAGSVAKAFVPHPSLGAVTFWQGIVEIVLRAVVIVSGLYCVSLFVIPRLINRLSLCRNMFIAVQNRG